MSAMPQSVGKTMRGLGGASEMLALVVVAWSALAWAPGAAHAGEGVAGRDAGRLAQLLRYSASGTHQCGGNRSCIVSGQFNDCNDAMSSLRTRDCCATARGGGSSTGFALNYCIPESFRR
jgi:hypothetical protein